MRRYIGPSRDLAINFLKERDGFKCRICNLDWSTCSDIERKKSITIDHINGNYLDNSTTNLRLLCRSCNVKAWKEQRLNISSTLSKGTYERERKIIPTEEDGYSANKAFVAEPIFRRFIISMISKAGDIPLKHKDLLPAGAEYADINTTTAYKYLSKMKNSINGILEPTRNDKQELVIIFRNRSYYLLTIQELLKIDGRRNQDKNYEG